MKREPDEHLLMKIECVEEAIESLEEAQERLEDLDDQAIEYIGKIIRRLKRDWFYEDL